MNSNEASNEVEIHGRHTGGIKTITVMGSSSVKVGYNLADK
jgi:hypothetical protein